MERNRIMDFISLDRMFGLFQSGRRGFGKFFTIGGMVKLKKRSKPNKGPKPKKGFSFLKTKITKKIVCHSPPYPVGG